MKGAWTQTPVAGKKADIFEPGDNPRFGVLFLHGIGMETLCDNPIFSRLFEELQIGCICPHGQRSWWADRVCAEFDPHGTPEGFLLEHIYPLFRARWNLGDRAVGLLGISMGGQGVLRLAFKHTHLFPAVAAIASALDCHEIYGQGTTLDEMYDSKEQCRQDTALMHVHPTQFPPHIFFCIDPEDVLWHRGNDRLHEKLNALGIEHTCDLVTRAGGHSWQYFNSMAERAVRFLCEGLIQESRRLL